MTDLQDLECTFEIADDNLETVLSWIRTDEDIPVEQIESLNAVFMEQLVDYTLLAVQTKLLSCSYDEVKPFAEGVLRLCQDLIYLLCKLNTECDTPRTTEIEQKWDALHTQVVNEFAA